MLTWDNGTHFAYDMIGEFRSCGTWIHGRRTIQSHEVILVLEGTVYIAEEGREYALEPHQLLVLEPGKEHYGYRASDAPVAFYWFHYFSDLPLPLKLYTGGDVYAVTQLLKRLLHTANARPDATAAADAIGYLVWDELNRLAAEEHHADHALDVQVTEYIRNHIDTELSVAAIAAHVGYSPDHLSKCFRRWHGVGLKEYIIHRRMQQAKNRLLTTTLSVKEIAASLGYREENRFIKFFLYHEGISPTAFRSHYCHTHINSR